MTTFSATEPTREGSVIDFTGEAPITLRYPIMIGDDFSRQFTLEQVGFDYTGSTVEYWIKDAKPPAGTVLYTDTIAVFGVEIPVLATDTGSAKFNLVIPAATTETLARGKFYGAVRITYGDNTKQTLFLLELNTTPVE